MNAEELIVSLLNPNASDTEGRHVEIRKADGYWFVDIVRPEGLDTHRQAYQNYSTDLNLALQGLFGMMQEIDGV
jgi:hypothetical protein